MKEKTGNMRAILLLLVAIISLQYHTVCSTCAFTSCHVGPRQIHISGGSLTNIHQPSSSSSVSSFAVIRRRSNLICKSLHSQQQNDNNHHHDNNNDGIRLNKVFKATHSRREADKLIESGRVRVNGVPILNRGGMKVAPYEDEITLDGQIVTGWEKMNSIHQNSSQQHHHDSSSSSSLLNTSSSTSTFEYVKYFKPIGITCTTDRRIKDNIIDTIKLDGYNPRHRVYPVGRLDKETTGLIVLTSDGRLVNSVLRGENKKTKIYKVMVNGRLEECHLQQLRVSLFSVSFSLVHV